MIQYSVAVGNGQLDAIETVGGTSPYLRIYDGTMPADCATALSGNTLLAEGQLPSDWMAAASSRSKSKSGTWSLTGQSGAGTGTNGTFWRLYKSDGTTCFAQGTLGTPFTINTSALTAANGNVLTFAATTNVAVGQNVSGTGILAGTKVIAKTSTTVTLSQSSTAGVSSGATIRFFYDIEADNTSIANSQAVSVNSFTITGSNG